MPFKNKDKEKQRQQTKYQSIKLQKPFTLKCWAIKSKSAQFAIPFDLTPNYLETIWTGKCFFSEKEISLLYDRKDEWSAEIDRLFPEKGYTKGNVVWVSRRFNRLKSDGSAEEHRLIADRLDTLRKEYGSTFAG